MKTTMLTHILLPTDDSEQCRKVIDGALELAYATGCRLTVYTCVEKFPNMVYSTDVGECLHTYCMETVQGYVKECIEYVAEHVREEGVQFDSDVPQFAESYLGILDAAKRRAYDVISVAPHEHRSLMGQLLVGNEAREVLTYAGVPVAVYR